MTKIKEFNIDLLNLENKIIRKKKIKTYLPEFDIFLKVAIDLELSDAKLQPEIDHKKSLIRDIIIRTFSSKTFEEISTIKGKDKLKDEVLDKINENLSDGYIKNIYFTDFVVQ